MTSLRPRAPYTDEELRTLYPEGLELQLVQVLLRHGERTPVSARFQNTGLPPFWPYCSAVRQLKSAVLEDIDQTPAAGGVARFDTLHWRRRLETFGARDEPVVATGPGGQLDDVCDMGALTDVGRVSTYQLGRRLRHLYVDRLRFLPPTLASGDVLYLRSTPVPRALESLHQTFSALYPAATRLPGPGGERPYPTILTRAPGDETLYPNDGNCRRFAALSRAFAQRAADRWNASREMAYLDRLWRRWMPADSPRVAVDARPRLSGIMDTVNATLAHGPETRLPAEFYDERARALMARIAVDEWFSGYKESREYRALGIGSLMGDVVARMVGRIERRGGGGGGGGGGDPEEYDVVRTSGQGHAHLKFGLSGCHDTTLAAILSSLGAFGDDEWPPFTSHIAIEMFRRASPTPGPTGAAGASAEGGGAGGGRASWWRNVVGAGATASAGGIGRRPMEELTPAERQQLDGYYVRLRYNDEPVTIPGCRLPGNHLEGDESFCTLAAFKSIVDKFTPKNWKQECRMNADAPPLSTGEREPAGY